MLREEIDQQHLGGMEIAVCPLNRRFPPPIEWPLPPRLTFARFPDMAQQMID
jgi:hypothetical protein